MCKGVIPKVCASFHACKFTFTLGSFLVSRILVWRERITLISAIYTNVNFRRLRNIY